MGVKKRGSIVLLTLALVACQDSSHVNKEQTQQNEKVSIADDIQFKQDYDVTPEMQSFPIYEIGELIQQLMLDQAQSHYGWEHLANDAHIQWTTEGYDEQRDATGYQSITQRDGLVRVHILGERVGDLRDRHYETPWKLHYEGGAAKFGVKQIDLEPSGDFKTFPDPLASLKKQKIKANVICSQKFAGEEIKAYQLQAKNKHDLFLVDRTSTGSGGSTRWLSLYLDDQSTEWCPDDAEVGVASTVG